MIRRALHRRPLRLHTTSHCSPSLGRCGLLALVKPVPLPVDRLCAPVPSRDSTWHPAPHTSASSPKTYDCVVTSPRKAKAKGTFSCPHVCTCYCSVSLLPFPANLAMVVPAATPPNPPPILLKHSSVHPLSPPPHLPCPCCPRAQWWPPSGEIQSSSSVFTERESVPHPSPGFLWLRAILGAAIDTSPQSLSPSAPPRFPLFLCVSSSPLIRTPVIAWGRPTLPYHSSQ